LMSRESGQKFVVTESLFSMDGDVAPLAALASLCAEHDAALIVDEAHAVGVFGARGSGLTESIPTFATINTGGKALGVSGAFVAASATAVDYLVQRARPFIFSTAPPPAVAAALDAALDLVESEPQRRESLLAKSKLLRERLGVDGLSQIIPFLIGDNEKAVAIAAKLQAEGFDVRAIRPPTVPVGTARLRISLNCGVDDAALLRFADCLDDAQGTVRHRH